MSPQSESITKARDCAVSSAFAVCRDEIALLTGLIVSISRSTRSILPPGVQASSRHVPASAYSERRIRISSFGLTSLYLNVIPLSLYGGRLMEGVCAKSNNSVSADTRSCAR
jgi:hypothetical protein